MRSLKEWLQEARDGPKAECWKSKEDEGDLAKSQEVARELGGTEDTVAS